ncbi:3'(2'),5'-bisphosphate nucleotidase CysQ [uncultured Endozoicomonas sp.]|uniref:3'(2'),5'-bisphosphate nucleotidase CysQ n=1 Tax=uncultured Endozoicomonas sp. TaxID=432652 RepID=UPI0026367CA8|nr:3'(2'),5'-bisphosphate nucleotidase CysQ [uncultured Endozoicomonas sp.]
MTVFSVESLIPDLLAIARKAGDEIMAIYHLEDQGIRTKSDSTPVTKADLAANAVIIKGLESLPVNYPILSEESEHKDWAIRQQWQRYWLVDPLDGTKEFINRNGQFTVNIALIDQRYPILGIVYVPCMDTVYYGGKGLGSWKQEGASAAVAISPRKFEPEIDVVVLGSRSYGSERAQQYIEGLQAMHPNLELKKMGSSLKSCAVAEGSADMYPRLGPTSEWDTGAAQAVVEGAGGIFLDSEGMRFSYNQKESLINSDFLVMGDRQVELADFWPPKV